MQTLVKIAWRNVWRNKRRSLITAASVVTAVFFIVLGESFNQGVSDYLIDNEIRLYTAHIEITGGAYATQRGIDHAMTSVDTLLMLLNAMPEVIGVTRRLEMPVLASAGNESIPALAWGVEEEARPGFFNHAEIISSGHATPGQVVLGTLMAEELGVQHGDSLVLVGHTYRRRIAAGIYRISGIAKIPIPDLSKHVIFVPIGLLQELADIPGGATSVLVNLKDKHQAEKVRTAIAGGTPGQDLSVRTWTETLSGRLATYRLRAAGVNVMKILLYILLGFGILGAVMLTFNERQKEYRRLVQLGMKKRLLAATLITEMLFITCFGLAGGLFIVMPIVGWLSHHPVRVWGEMAVMMNEFNVEPVLMMSTKAAIFVHSTLLVFLITLVITLIVTATAVRALRT